MSNSIEIFKSDDGHLELKVAFDHDTVWLAQDQLCELFGRERSVITKHINNLFMEGELERGSVCAKFARTADDGKTYQTQHYNLDVIISVGYRVNSTQATQFRIWATALIKEYIIKGFAMDDERLKNGRYFGKDCFKELMERAVSAFFDYIEVIIERRNTFTMEGFAESVNKRMVEVVSVLKTTIEYGARTFMRLEKTHEYNELCREAAVSILETAQQEGVSRTFAYPPRFAFDFQGRWPCKRM